MIGALFAGLVSGDALITLGTLIAGAVIGIPGSIIQFKVIDGLFRDEE